MKLEKSWLLCLPFVSSLFRHFSFRNPSGSCVIFDNFHPTPFFFLHSLGSRLREQKEVEGKSGEESEEKDEKGESQN